MDLRAKLHTLGQLSRENLLKAQERQQRLYNRGTKLRQFSPGDKVLVLLPTSRTKLLAKWQGPFVVTRRVGEVDYEVQWADNREGTNLPPQSVKSLERDLSPSQRTDLALKTERRDDSKIKSTKKEPQEFRNKVL